MDDPPNDFSSWQPEHPGPALVKDQAPALGVYASPAAGGSPIGAAYSAGLVEHPRGPAHVFRLLVGGAEVEGRFLLEGGRFVRLGDAAEVQAG